MGFNVRLVNNYLSTGSTTLNGVTAGTTTGGNTLLMATVAPGTLSATCAVTAATATITITPKWQVSNDNTTWIDCASMNDAANVVEATGTAAIVTKVLDAPMSAYGWRYARMSVVTGVVTAGAGDLYNMGYNFLKPESF